VNDPFALGDELGPVKVIHVREPKLGLRGVLVVDNVAAGPAIGGMRMAADVSLGECARLARAMTLKNAAAGLPHGGGKSALIADPHMPPAQKAELVRAFACALRDERDYIFGPDMGTDETCMAFVHDEVGRAVGLPRERGGIPLDELGATAFGLRAAIDVAAKRAGFPLAGARFVVQGFGSVGAHAARLLAAEGALLVGAADSGGAVASAEGLDVAALLSWKRAGRGVAEFAGGSPVTTRELLALDCEIWIPAARPDAIREDDAPRVRARLIAPGANIAVTLGAERALAARGVTCLPDFIVNAGGVICAAAEYRRASEAEAFREIEARIRANTETVLANAEAQRVTPRAAAEALARERVRRAMATRRWSIY
jgi:glutamate dehydrogenase/leucine dehydrogenase